jgi:hypothetical protein
MKLFVLFGQDSREVTPYNSAHRYYGTFSSLENAQKWVSSMMGYSDWVEENQLLIARSDHGNPINYVIMEDTLDDMMETIR